MNDIPDKCITCDHTIMQFENVHKGWCKYQIEPVVRCDCFPAHYIVGCVSAEVYCVKKPRGSLRRLRKKQRKEQE